MTGSSAKPMLLHATAIAIDRQGVLLTGPSGAGKSDLALQLIDRGAELISDDQVEARPQQGQLMLDAPDRIAGKIEVHSLGIFDCPSVSAIPCRLIVELSQDPERYPMDRAIQQLCEVTLPVAHIDPRLASAAIKIEWALRRCLSQGSGQE